MGEVAVGDLLLGDDGKPTRVVATTEVMKNRPCYRVEFSDGTKIIADAEHQWVTSSRQERAGRRRPNKPSQKIRTTEEILTTLTVKDGGAGARLNHSVRIASPLELPEADLLIPPYVLGAWLGDGHSAAAMLTSADPEIFEYFKHAGVLAEKRAGKYAYALKFEEKRPKIDAEVLVCQQCGAKLANSNYKSGPNVRKTNLCAKHVHFYTLSYKLRELSVFNNKHIPEQYLRASFQQRHDLLAGLLDTDGTVDPWGHVELGFASKRLAYGAYELIMSLGYKAAITKKIVKGAKPETSIFYRIHFAAKDQLFKLNRKASRVAAALETPNRATQHVRYVTAVIKVDSVPVRCVQVDNESHMYLASRSMIPTHNSTISNLMAYTLAQQGKKVLIISGEETESQIASRIQRLGAIDDNVFLMSESSLPNALEAIQELQPDFFVVDSLQTLVSGDSESRVGSPSQVTDVANGITSLAKRMGIPCLIIGHITKDGQVAGPRVVEHLVDVVLYFEANEDSPLRILRGIKNRFGSLEVGVFEHTADGFEAVEDPSGYFLVQHENGVTGYATSIVIEGNRALPIEVQALVAPTKMPNPRRISNGLDNGRVIMIQAILEKHAGIRLSEKDIYVSTTGGLLVKDSSIDLAIAAAIMSSANNVAVPTGSVFLGETTLTGEVRPARGIKKRAAEARRLGFKQIVEPAAGKDKDGMHGSTVDTIRDLRALLAPKD